MREKNVSVLLSTQSMYNTMWSLLPFAHYHLPSHLEGGRRREEGDLMMKQWGGQLKSVSSVETKLTVIYLLFLRHTPTLYQDTPHSSLTHSDYLSSPFSFFWLSLLIITFYIDSVALMLYIETVLLIDIEIKSMSRRRKLTTYNAVFENPNSLKTLNCNGINHSYLWW